MTKPTRVLLGTGKGVFVLESSAGRTDWQLHGPYCKTNPINHVIGANGALYAASGGWNGPSVWRSGDLGHSWSKCGGTFSFGEDEPEIKSVWSLANIGDRLLAGVEPAGLFESVDEGASWQHVSGLRGHPSSKEWGPGGGGLILHHILPDPHDINGLWVGISVAGVYYSADGGLSWQPRNQGTRQDYAPEGERYPEHGQCVHAIAAHGKLAGRLYQQNHCGMYRSDDGGLSWASIEDGLPSSFGFPCVAHAHDPDCVYLFPLNGDDQGRYPVHGRAAIWRSRDAGRSWVECRNGLPPEHAYFTVLRQAMDVDRHDRSGVYFGTTSGSVFASMDEGESWASLADHLPIIYSVSVL